MSEYKVERERIIDSFNSLMNGISRTNNIGLKKQAVKFSDRFELFMNLIVDFDQILANIEVLENKSDKLELMLSLFLPFSLHHSISESDVLEMKRLQLGNYYAIRSFIQDSSLVSEVNVYRKLGFRFKSGLNRDELRLKVDDCRKKLIKKHANSSKQTK